MKQENLHEGHRDRLRERFCSADETNTVEGNFRDHELLELLLFFSQPRVNTNETAHRLLNRFGSMRGVLEAPLVSLIQVDGIGKKTALLIRLISAMMRAYIRSDETPASQIRLTTIPALIPMIRRMYLAETAVEHVFLMLFDTAGIHKKTIRISDGTQSEAVIDIANCVRMAVIYDASTAVLVHNHPSVPLPSEEDRLTTSRLYAALSQVRVELREHLILTEDSCYGIQSDQFLQNKG